MRLLRVSVYWKIMAIFVGAMILLYAFSIIIYERNVSYLKKQQTESVSMLEQKYLEQIEQNIMKVKELTFASTFKQDWFLLSTKRGVINNYDTLQLVLYAQERLQAIKNSSILISDVRAHLALWGRTISSESGIMDLQTEEFEKIRMPQDASGAQFVYYNDGIYLSSTYQYKYPVNYDIVLKLNMKELDSSLESLNIFNKSYTFLVRRDNGQVLAASNSDKAFFNDLRLPDLRNNRSGSSTMNIGSEKYMCVYNTSDFLGFTVVNMLPANELYKPLNIYYLMIWLFSIVVLLIMVIYIYYTYKAVGKPMHILIDAFKRMENGDFSVRLERNARDDFAYLYNSFDSMAQNIQHLVGEVYEKEILVQRANLKQLQSQINPHFLYNSFYILHRMIKLGDNENAELFSAYLGKYFKYITRNAMDEVPVSLEVEHAMIYSGIMSMRLGDGVVKVEFDKIPERFSEVMAPRMLLQPLLENAFEHGIKDLPKEALIKVYFREDGNDLLIFIEDNGKGMPHEDLLKINEQMGNLHVNSEITGVLNIHRRLQLMYGEGYGLTINAGEFEGTQIILRLGQVRRAADDFQDTSGR